MKISKGILAKNQVGTFPEDELAYCMTNFSQLITIHVQNVHLLQVIVFLLKILQDCKLFLQGENQALNKQLYLALEELFLI